jgi:multicomponent K+:H+ antiporter subunit G
MIQAPDLPGWAALIVALLMLSGAAAALIGSIGLLRLGTFFERLHPPTLGSSMGMGLIVLASILCFSVLRGQLSVHEVLIAAFLTTTTPVALMLLARSALYRERAERRTEMLWDESGGKRGAADPKGSRSGNMPRGQGTKEEERSR